MRALFFIMGEHMFTTFVRTKTLFKHRLKDLKDYKTVKIYIYELKKLGVNNGPFLYGLRERGEIWYDKDGNFRALRNGPVDPSLLLLTKKRAKVKAPLNELHLWMRGLLRHVSLDVPKETEIPVYFAAFLEHRDKSLDAFFSVDSFSGRVHSPVVNLKGELRLGLRFYGQKVVSLDVKQMQPTILAKVLSRSVGDNAFSTAIFDGEDVYMLLLRKNREINTRSQAKKFLFQLIFGKPMEDIGTMFEGDNEWVHWINSYKSRVEPKNPHKEDKHTNLAWLLQYSEVQVMTDIWKRLRAMEIPFLTIHDDVLVRATDKDRVYDVMYEVLKRHFKFFTITVTE